MVFNQYCDKSRKVKPEFLEPTQTNYLVIGEAIMSSFSEVISLRQWIRLTVGRKY